MKTSQPIPAIITPSLLAMHNRSLMSPVTFRLLLACVCCAVASSIAVAADRSLELFRHGSLKHWMSPQGKKIAGGWEVTDGVIHRVSRAGHMITKEEFTDFDLRFEWKIARGGNSGIKYRVNWYGDRLLGCEYQLLDDERHRNALNPTKTAGALYDLYAPHSSKRLKPVGEYNSGRILVRGQHVEHWLNGQKIVEAEIGSDDWDCRVRKSKFSEYSGFAEKTSGRLMLQDHGGEVWLRNVVLTIPESVSR